MDWSSLKYWFKRKNRKPQHIPVVLITGCGSGLGLELARLFYALDTYRVVITARAHSLPELRRRFPENERFAIRELDVTSEASREAVIRETQKLFGDINILINNAGISYRSVVEHMTEEDEQLQMATNYFGPMGLIRLVVPAMRRAGRGKIINISSVSGMLAMPTMASYSASKHALEGASEALWYEMKPLGISVTMIQPGFINSNSFKNVYYTRHSHPDSCMSGDYSDYYAHMTPFIARLMRWSPTTPEHIARLILKVIRTENPPLWVPATWDAVIFYYLRRILPRRLLHPVLFWLLPNSRTWAMAYSRRRDLRPPKSGTDA